MRRILWFFFLLFVQCTPQVFAQDKPTGDIDMNQFKNLEDKDQRRTPESRVQITTTCTDAHGAVIKKGETGFDTCLSNSQARLLKPNANPEAPDDVRKH